MKTNVEKVSNLTRKLNVEIPAEQVQVAFNRVFQGLQKEVTVAGFRKGKVPLQKIKSIYGDKVKQDVAQELIQKHYTKALNEHKLEPISYPEFEFKDPSESSDFTFSANFDIKPEVTLKKYEGLEVLKEKMSFDESRVEQVLENIRGSHAKFEPLIETRACKNGDVAVIDFDGSVDGKPLENGKGVDHNLELGAKQFIEGFEEGVVGMNVGDERTLTLKFPEKYHAVELSGKPVEFKVKLKQIKKRVLPELNDEFLATIGGPKDLETLKKEIREDLSQSEQKRIDEAFKNRMLKALVSSNPVEVPPSLLAEQKTALISDFQKRMTEQGMNETEYNEYVKKWDKDFESTATEMIQASFLIDMIAQKHGLTCKREDVDAKFTEYAKQTGIDEARIKEFYGKPEQMSRLTYMITEEKVIKFLTESAKVKEVEKSQLKEESN